MLLLQVEGDDNYMMENKYLNEEKYQKNEKSITLIAILILVVGLCVGGFLIYKGVVKPGTIKVDELKVQLETKKSELEAKGVRFSEFAKYTDGEAYDLKIITKALDPSFNNCAFDEYKSNSITKEYCSAKNSTGDFASRSSIMFGAFICIATCMISGFIFMVAKRRSILAFQIQQVMPIAKEGFHEGVNEMEKMAPKMGNAASEIAKGVTRGIKKGLKDDEK